jgi:selT/selW/selH-like putative selenoprotein
MQMAQSLGYLKLALIVCILATFNPFPMMGMDTPSAFSWALENKMYACMMLFFISNAVESQLVSTGAFEISVDNMPVWSKLESGRIPQPPELFQIIDTHLQMNSGQGMRLDDAGGGNPPFHGEL